MADLYDTISCCGDQLTGFSWDVARETLLETAVMYLIDFHLQTLFVWLFSPHWTQTASLAVCIQRLEPHPSHYESICRLRDVGKVQQRCSAVLNQNMIYILINHSAAKLTVVIKLSSILRVSQTFIVTPPRATLKCFSATCSSWLLCLTNRASPVASSFVLCKCTRALRYLLQDAMSQVGN